MPVELICWGKKKINGCQDYVPQIFLDNPKVIQSLLPTLIIVRHVLDAGSESAIHQHYGKPQAKKGISELGYAPDSVTLSAYHVA